MFEIRWTLQAKKDLKNLEKETASRIIKKIASVKDNPFHFLDMLKGYQYYKLRIGDYRAIIDIDNKKQILTVILIGHRKKIYKTLDRK